MLARRVDANHSAIVDALRRLGCSVLDLSRVGRGCPDILCGYGGISLPAEIKTAKGKFNDRQNEFLSQWTGGCYLLRTVEDCAELANTLRAWHQAIREGRKNDATQRRAGGA